MGGSPRHKEKPRASYEDGALRDASIEEKQGEAYNGPALRPLIRRATKASGDAGGTPANRA